MDKQNITNDIKVPNNDMEILKKYFLQKQNEIEKFKTIHLKALLEKIYSESILSPA